MRDAPSNTKVLLLAICALLSCFSVSANAQSSTAIVGRDSVTVVPGPDYAAGSFHRTLLGDNYRDVWTSSIKVPVLDLKRFAGGLTPTKVGGGQQTMSLRFVAPDSSEWVFRSVHKGSNVLSKEFKHTVASYVVENYGSASHPTGNLPSAVFLRAAGLLHPTPRLAIMPDDPALGEFRKEFTGMLGTIEEYPSVPKQGVAFADAKEIIDAEDLLKKIDKDPKDRIDDRAFLTAVLMDLFLGDNDRHPDQWKWAQLGGDKSDWEPIARDRDHVFVSYGGMIGSLARLVMPSLVSFDGHYSSPTAVLANALDFDRRMLSGLNRAVWDSVALSLTNTLSDAVIDKAIAALPPQYAPTSLRISASLRERRNALREEAADYYQTLSTVVDVQGTDADDKADIKRNVDGSVDVKLSSDKGDTYFSRRFLPGETKEIRVYLHDGDDKATVTGSAPGSIHTRVIGGNGKNTLVDRSSVGGDRHPTHFLDEGPTDGVYYAVDSVAAKLNVDDEMNHRYNRRPWLVAYDTLIPPQRDYGSSVKPTGKINTGRGLGFVPRIGFSRYTYGFRDVPYSSLLKADLGYSTKHRGFAANFLADKRLESTQVHVPVSAQLTQIEIVQFRGFGNDVPDSKDEFYDVRQFQRNFRPAIGFSPNPVSDISIGPIVRYTTTDSVRNRFISQTNPYGTGSFGQAGMQLKAHYETRSKPDTLKPRGVLDFAGSGYPSLWDAKSAYGSVDGFAAAFMTLPIPKKPVIALRAGGKKLFGDFPYFDAAFLGGSRSIRAIDHQQYAGDASVYGNAELRVPVAKFPLILPLDVGLIGFADAGRVYVNGDSPGGWHSSAGAGVWIGLLNPGTNFNILATNNKDRRITTSIGFAY
ncbi:MAG: BamA/TamA family outer membrane protein [Gemmatimonadaceae bacterium]